MKKNLFFLAAAALMAAACSNEDGDKASMPAKINVKTTMSAAVTRTSDQYQGSALDTESSPAIYVVKEGTTAITNGYFYKNIAATGTSSLTTTPTLYFPQDKTDVDVYVYAPRKNEGIDDLTTGISHTIDMNQYNKAAYLASDFVIGKQNVEYNANDANVTVKLFHAMSKIKLVITDADGQTSTLGQLTSATLSAIKNTCTVYPVKAPATADGTNDAMTDAGTPANNTVQNVSGSETLTLLSVGTSGADALAYTLYGIVPPQTLNSTLTLTIGGNTYATESAINTELKSGYEYTFNVKLNQAKLTVTTVTIQEWSTSSAGDVTVK